MPGYLAYVLFHLRDDAAPIEPLTYDLHTLPT